MDEYYYTGEIILIPYKFMPVNFMLCDGSQLSQKEYPALYSIIGRLYGAATSTTFCLPNLVGNIVAHRDNSNQKTSLATSVNTNITSSTISVQNIPTIYGRMQLQSDVATTSAYTNSGGVQMTMCSAFNTKSGKTTQLLDNFYTNSSEGQLIPQQQLLYTNTSGNTPISIMQPTIDLVYAICVNGVFPISN